MDPVTAALILANTLAQIELAYVNAMSPADRALIAKQQFDDIQKMRAWLLALKLPTLPLPGHA